LSAIEESGEAGWVRIDVAPGNYYEKVVIRRDRIRIAGSGTAETRLHFDAVAQTAGKYHRDGWGTPGSATLTIDADQVVVEGLTIENTFDYLSNDALPDDDPDKLVHSQGVALLLDIHSDRVHLDRVSLIAYQDTLFANGGCAYITKSFVAGNVDFIFGNGQLLIEDSTIESRRRGKPYEPGEIQSFITAPSTQLADRVGIVIHRSRLTREDGVPDQSVTLGRPWHPTTDFADGRYADPNAVGQALFIDCFMEAHIHEQHWSIMHGTARDGTKSDIFQPQDSRFYEVGSNGPGAARVDIGILWSDAPTIDDVYSVMFADWPVKVEQNPDQV
jgi:pectinesterase